MIVNDIELTVENKISHVYPVNHAVTDVRER